MSAGVGMLTDRTKRVDAVIGWLRPIAEPVASEAEHARWIGALNADPDQSEDWCTACARVEVERLNALHPDHEYVVDGGWGSSTDCPPSCCKCGKSLDGHFTAAAIGYEMDHYDRHSVSLRKCAAEKAFRFIQMLESGCFDENDSSMWRFFRRLERMHKRRFIVLEMSA